METFNRVPNRVRRSSLPIMPKLPNERYEFESSTHKPFNSEPSLPKYLFFEPESPINESRNKKIPQDTSPGLTSSITASNFELESLVLNTSYAGTSDTSTTGSIPLRGGQTSNDFREPILKPLLRLSLSTVSSMNQTYYINVCIDATSEATIICADLGAVLPWPEYVITWRLFGVDFALKNIKILERKDLPIKGVDGIFGSEFLLRFSYMTFKAVSEKYVLPSRISVAYPFLPPQNYQGVLRVYTEIVVHSSNVRQNSEVQKLSPFVGVGVFLGWKVSLNTWIPYFIDNPVFQSESGLVDTKYILELAVFEAFIAICEAVAGKSNISPFSRIEFYTKQLVLVSWWESVLRSEGITSGSGDFCPFLGRYKHFMDLRNQFAIDVNSHEHDCFNILPYTDDNYPKQAQNELAGEQAVLLAEVAINASREQVYSQDVYIKFLPECCALVSKLSMKIALNMIHLAYKKHSKGISCHKNKGTDLDTSKKNEILKKLSISEVNNGDATSSTVQSTAHQENIYSHTLVIGMEDKVAAQRAEVQRQVWEAEARRIISQAQVEAKEILSQAKNVWIQGINCQLMASATANKIYSEAEAEAHRIKLQALYTVNSFEEQRERIVKATSYSNLMELGPEKIGFASNHISEEISNVFSTAKAEEIIKYTEKVKRDAEIEATKIVQKATRDAKTEAEKIKRDAEEIRKEAQEMKRDTEAKANRTRKDFEELRKQAKIVKDTEETRGHSEKVKEDIKAEVEKCRKDTKEIREQAEAIKRDSEANARKTIQEAENTKIQVGKMKAGAEAEVEKAKRNAERIKIQANKTKMDADTLYMAKIANVEALIKQTEETKRKAEIEAEQIKIEAAQEGEKMTEKIEMEAVKAAQDLSIATKKMKEAESMIRVAEKNLSDAEATMAKAKEDAAHITTEARKVKKEAESAKDHAFTISKKLKAEAKSEASKIKAYAENVLKEAEEIKKDAEVKAKKTIQEGERIRRENEIAAATLEKKLKDLELQKEESVKEIAENMKVREKMKRFDEDSIEKATLEADTKQSMPLIAPKVGVAEVAAQIIINRAKDKAALIIQNALQAEDDHPIHGDVLGSALPLTPEGFYKMFLENPNDMGDNKPMSSLEFINILENSQKEITLGQIIDHCPEVAGEFFEECESDGRLVHKIELYMGRLDGRLKFKKGRRIISYDSVKDEWI